MERGYGFYVKIRTGIKEEMGFMKKNMNGFTDRRWVIQGSNWVCKQDFGL